MWMLPTPDFSGFWTSVGPACSKISEMMTDGIAAANVYRVPLAITGLFLGLGLACDRLAVYRKKLRKAYQLNQHYAALMGKSMILRGKRKAEIELLTMDVITDGMEQLELEGKITREEKLAIYQRFGHLYDWNDLLPKGQKTVKKQLAENKEKRAKNGEKKKVLPGTDYVNGLPDNDENKTNVVVFDPKNKFASFVRSKTA